MTKMAVIKLDLSNAGKTNNVLPSGEYQAFVFDVSHKENNAKDGYYLNWQFRIRNGEYEGKTVFHITSLKENALFKLRELLDGLQVEIPEGGLMELDTDDLMGKKCTLILGEREYMGKAQNEVKEVLVAKDVEEDTFNDDY